MTTEEEPAAVGPTLPRGRLPAFGGLCFSVLLTMQLWGATDGGEAVTLTIRFVDGVSHSTDPQPETEGPRAFYVGAPIQLEATMLNRSQEERTIDAGWLLVPAAYIVERRQDGMVLESLKGPPLPLRVYSAKKLAPGERHTVRVDLLKHYPLVLLPSHPLAFECLAVADEYSVKVVGRVLNSSSAPLPDEGTSEDPPHLRIMSNVLRFSVAGWTPELIERHLADFEQTDVREKQRRVRLLAYASSGDVAAVFAPRVAAALARLASEDSSRNVRILSLNALRRIGDQSVAPTLLRIVLEDTDPTVRAYAAGQLGKWRVKSSVPTLIAVLRQRTPAANPEAHHVWYSAIVVALG